MQARVAADQIVRDLTEAARSSEERGWGKYLLKKFETHKGDVVDLVIDIAIHIARSAAGS